MDKGGGAPQPAVASTVGLRGTYIGWEEVFVSNDKGRREVHYYLKKKDGSSDLAVVGKEKSLRHMAYQYAIHNRVLVDLAPRSSLVKLRSRREVIEWLNSVVPDSPSHILSQTSSDTSDDKQTRQLNLETRKDTHPQALSQHTKEFVWLGSSWTCKKKRRHYQSFYRNGVKISVNDFVYVLAEEDKRLVAYLDDLYEDSRGNKMVVVQWFHKIDEVGIDLPLNFNRREIFFSLCLQDLSIECVDGLATVLSPEHFDKFLNEAKNTKLEPFICHRQYDNDELKPFDITQVKGYWNQEILRHMHTVPFSRALAKSYPSDIGLIVEDQNNSNGCGPTPRKRLRLSRGGVKVVLPHQIRKDSSCGTCFNNQNQFLSLAECRTAGGVCNVKKSASDASISRKEVNLVVSTPHLPVGSEVEVLSQDSGLRGCWFRALVIKKHKDKVKLRYQDIKDADDEAYNLEEWVLAARIAVRDDLGLRNYGRTTIRPSPLLHDGKVSWVIDVGAVVDAWWHDGWWEGIVIQQESEDTFHVYFPGEKREAVLSRGDLRHSQEWLGNIWKDLKGRPDLAASILSDLEKQRGMGKTSDRKQAQTLVGNKQLEACKDTSSSWGDDCCTNSPVVCRNNSGSDLAVPDLLKDDTFSQLKWKSSKKRRRAGGSVQKLQCSDSNSRSPVGSGKTGEDLSAQSSPKVDNDSFKSFKVDRENCKFIGDSLFNSSVVPCLSSLVMSR
ncbi:hypothetical protein Ancab_018543 [Ancistrocladus abbreviatus]